MKKITITTLAMVLAGCATQTPHVAVKEAPVSQEQQIEAQKTAAEITATQPLQLKRKIAIGRMSNETTYGRSLLRDDYMDPLGKQVGDMLSARLINSGNFLVFERPDLARIEQERALFGAGGELVGVDTLIVGSLTEFGRNVTGESGFLSSTKTQKAHAKVELRLVDVNTGQAFFSATGAGEATLESASVAGFGSRAAYDGTLTDKAIAAAISDVIDEMIQKMMERPWKTFILDIADGQVFISGGKSQGLAPGKQLKVMTAGKQIESRQTGFMITLPGAEVATVEVVSTFGDSESNEGSLVKIISGTLDGHRLETLEVVE
ncbi:CsgG/HfaB family protein [Endozoicomonas sp. SESOKO1]|uniref:CsgG/HfaB family protein n=1 Tax=Endozoicomonas sp. SESOKO1 TaxID=2828742 RepID=UPI002147EB4B|nr:CsgG/HfaB family protein [Endozoicomonas sp. SESOKO1]